MKLIDTGYRSQIPVIRHYVGLLPPIINPFLRASYSNGKSLIRNFYSWNIDRKKEFILHNMRENVEYAYGNVPFYREYYNRHNFSPSYLKKFEDIQLIPRIDKNILLEYPIEQRCCRIKDAIKVNTGGSSGHTLSFYSDTARVRNELIHMTAIWEKVGYKNSDLKLIMNGQNTVMTGLDYCFKSNSIRLDIYKEFSQLAPKLKKIAGKIPIRFLHGYPSLLYEFALFSDEFDHELRDILRKSLKGAFLGSEYPHHMFRDKIEEVFCIDTVNWYGHTEGAVLAYEKEEKYRYYPFQTYGFAEVSDENHLIASTYHNRATPFIRYDTEDSISDPQLENGLLISFSIKDGRSGEYVTDKNGRRISLTALIFGRHHRLFDFCSHIQIYQKIPGRAVVFYIPKDNSTELEPGSLFDSTNIDMDFIFTKLGYPIKTKAGKLNLLIKPDQPELNGQELS